MRAALTPNDLSNLAELTDRLLDATEDGILPESYQLGLVRQVLVLTSTLIFMRLL